MHLAYKDLNFLLLNWSTDVQLSKAEVPSTQEEHKKYMLELHSYAGTSDQDSWLVDWSLTALSVQISYIVP